MNNLITHEEFQMRGLCRRAANTYSWALQTANPDPIIKIECFDKEEANRVTSMMERLYPDIDFYCTWLNFKG